MNSGSRTTNNIGGDGGEKSSVKLHYAPGGKSNISLGWDGDSQQQKPTQSYQSYQPGNQGYQPSNNQQQQSYGQQNNYSNARPDLYGKSAPFATDDNNSNTKTSVKVHHAPGGQSNFSLGNEQTDYGRRGGNQGKEPEKTSVKVHNPPGGKSNFTLG